MFMCLSPCIRSIFDGVVLSALPATGKEALNPISFRSHQRSCIGRMLNLASSGGHQCVHHLCYSHAVIETAVVVPLHCSARIVRAEAYLATPSGWQYGCFEGSRRTSRCLGRRRAYSSTPRSSYPRQVQNQAPFRVHTALWTHLITPCKSLRYPATNMHREPDNIHQHMFDRSAADII